MSPRFSIIIPTYNVEKYIARCLKSCINQTYKNIEIIVVDDKGSDKSIEIAKSYASKDTRVKIVENIKNLGTFHTRIEGIKVANGKYILFLDADDYIELNTCKVLDKAIEDSHRQDDIYPDIVFFGMKFYPKTFKRAVHSILIQTLCNEEILKAIFINYIAHPWHIWAKLDKTSHIVRAINLPKIYTLYLLHLAIAKDIKSFIVVDLANKSIGIKDKSYIYYNNENSITRKIYLNITKKKLEYRYLIQDELKVVGAIN